MRFDLWTCAASAALLLGMALPANAQASGSYQATCRRIQASGAFLTAECRDPSGKYHSSTIAYTQCKGDIGNNNGTLFCNGAMATGAAPAGGGGGGGRASGGGAPAASNDPASGSFRATCRNIQTAGNMLRADCADPSGRYHGSSIAFGQCRSDIANSNGMLSCNGATAVADGANNNAYIPGNGPDNGNRGGGDGGNGQRGGNNFSNGPRDGNFSNGPNGGPGQGFGRNDNGPDNRDYRDGPRYDGPGRFGDGGRPYTGFTPGPYPQFDGRERNILRDIREGERDGSIRRRDADTLMDQLQEIQDREGRIYRAQGRYIRPDDSRRIDRDLDRLSDDVRRAAR